MSRQILQDIEPMTEQVRSEKKIREQLNKSGTSSDKKSCLETMAKYVAHFHVEETMKTSLRKYDKDIVHSLAILQALFYCVSVLNTLLGDVIKLPKPSDFFNGVFIYNMIVQVTKRSGMMNETLLPQNIQSDFQTTFDTFISHLPQLSNISAKTKKKKKIKPKIKSEDDTALAEEVNQTGSENEYFDVENRFAALKVSWAVETFVTVMKWRISNSNAADNSHTRGCEQIYIFFSSERMSLVAPRGVAAEPVDQGQARLEALLFKVRVIDVPFSIEFTSVFLIYSL